MIDDISDGIQTTGVMVTRTGYQAGAKRVADTYGLIVVELRVPTPEDTRDRLLKVRVEVVAGCRSSEI